MLLLILATLFILSISGGVWSHSRYGYWGWSPAALLVATLTVFWFRGALNF